MATVKTPAARKTRAKSNRGGPRPNSGRKPRPITELNRAIAERSDDAIYALDFYCETMRDIAQDIRLRLECAREVMNRVLGRPTERHEHSGDPDLPLKVIVEYADRDPRDPPETA